MATYIYKNYIRPSRNAPPEPPPSKSCRHRSEPDASPCPDCKAEKSRATKYRWKIILGLISPYALQALDATIIASALPWIASDFNQLSQQNWIVSAFTLSSAAFIPCWAQLADVFGRYVSLTAAVLIMMIGSALCTAAPTNAFPLLLLGRGFQGVAASGLNVVVRTILADRVTLKENAKNWAIFAIVGGVSYGVGPVIGGYLSGANWRWCFGINLPVGAVALIAIVFVLRKELLGPQPIPELDETVETGRRSRFAARLKTIDVGGQILFVLGFGLIVLALTWGGVTYAWNSVPVLVSLIVGVLLSVAFFIWERMLSPGRILSAKLVNQRPMIPWAMLTNRDVGLIFYTEIATGMALYSGYPPDKAGLQLLYFVPGMGVGVYLCAFVCNQWPRMTFPPLFFGTLIEAVGVGMLAWALYNEHLPTIFGMMALTGVGIGLRFMVAPLHGIGIFKNHRAALIGLMAIATPFGGTIGLTVMSTVFNNSSGLDYKHSDFSKIQELGGSALEKAIRDAKMGVVWAYVAILPFILASFICCFFLGNVKLGNRSAVDDEDANTNIVFTEPYLWSLIRGRTALLEEAAIRLESSHSKDGPRRLEAV